jgi:hypothetical protein
MTSPSLASELSGTRGRATVAALLAAVAAALLAILMLAGPALADPPGDLISPPNHRHFVQTSEGLVPVGPQICGNPQLQKAFNEFHYNIHHSVVPGVGPVTSLGPQDGAPGLHNGVGGDLIAIPGCG